MTTDENCLISAQDIFFSIGRKPVLWDVSLKLSMGKIVTLMGPNGAGKTTLLKILLGFLQPLSGHVIKKPKLRVGYIPQKMEVNPALPLTVHRFLELTRFPVLTPRQGLEKAGALHLLSAPLNGLSGGEFQRVILAKALIRKPQLLILDEPTQALDMEGQENFYGLIGYLREREGCGVLLVSHDLYVVMGTSDHVICLNGHICCAGHPACVQSDAAYLNLFPNFRKDSRVVTYTHHHDHSHEHDREKMGGTGHG